MNTNRLHTLLGLGAIAGPLLAFAGARFTGQLPGPASAHAAQKDTKPPAFVPLARTPLTPRQQQMLQGYQDPDFTSVPFPFYLSPARGEAPETPPSEAPPPSLSISSFMGGRSPLVIIDSRPRRVGDDLGDGWILTSIDAASRSLTITKGERTETIRAE